MPTIDATASRGVGQPSDSSSGSSDEEEAADEDVDSDGADPETAKAQEQWGVGALAANPTERIPDGGPPFSSRM